MPAEQLSSEMTLGQLLEGIAPAPDIGLAGIACDSRRVRPGYAFFARRGATHHGLEFHRQVADAGAVAIVYDPASVTRLPADLDIATVAVDGLEDQLGEIASRFYGRPSEQLAVVGVTGTNGKSTVAWLIAQAMFALGQRCGYAGTLGYGVDEIDPGDDMTSPDVFETQRRLARFVEDGAGYAAIEVSSHALDQHRVDGVAFDATLFTNLSRDHLDYHGGMLEYGEAKARLFTEHVAKRQIVNLDTEFGAELASRCGGDVVTVSTKFDRVANGRPYVFVRSVVHRAFGSSVRIQSSWGQLQLEVPLVGDFNVANIVLALAYLLATGVDPDAAVAALAGVTAPPGRMQLVPSAAGPAVYIDYAHTPSALEVALRVLSGHGRGKLWCVFGCGGDRDAGKRELMGRVAERLADRVVVTNDNPRGEEPRQIIDAVLSGMVSPSDATVIEDRGAAIAWAIANAAATDTVLIAGKGHESYQIIGDERLDFSDFGAAAANLDARAAGEET